MQLTRKVVSCASRAVTSGGGRLGEGDVGLGVVGALLRRFNLLLQLRRPRREGRALLLPSRLLLPWSIRHQLAQRRINCKYCCPVHALGDVMASTLLDAWLSIRPNSLIEVYLPGNVVGQKKKSSQINPSHTWILTMGLTLVAVTTKLLVLGGEHGRKSCAATRVHGLQLRD